MAKSYNHEVVFTEYEANIIKLWRKSGMSFRYISTSVTKKWPEKGCGGNSQLEGKCICDEAGKILNENHWEWK